MWALRYVDPGYTPKHASECRMHGIYSTEELALAARERFVKKLDEIRVSQGLTPTDKNYLDGCLFVQHFTVDEDEFSYLTAFLV